MPVEGSQRRRILVASNRGPVSFSRDEDGQLTAKRGGGGVVSGLSSVASSEDMLWVCAALSEADRAAARQSPGGLLDLDGHAGGSAVQMLDIPPATFNRAYNTVANSVLWFVHHMLYDTPNRPQFGFAFERDWAAYREYNQAFAQALAADAGSAQSRAVIQDYHLTLAPRMLAELRAGHQDRALLAHPVGASRLLPAAARFGRRRGAGRHPGRRPRRVPVPALGRRVHGLLRADPRCPGRPRPAAGQLRRARHRHRHPPARRRRRRADRTRLPARCRAGHGQPHRGDRRPEADRASRPDRAIEEHRPRPIRLPRAAADQARNGAARS